MKQSSASRSTGSTTSGFQLAAAIDQVQADVAPGLRVGSGGAPFGRAFLFGRFSRNLDAVRAFLTGIEHQITWADAVIAPDHGPGPFATIAFSYRGLKKLDIGVALAAAQHQAVPATGRTPFVRGPGYIMNYLAAEESASESENHDVLLSYAGFEDSTVRQLVDEALACSAITWNAVWWGRADNSAGRRPLGFSDPAKNAPGVDGFYVPSTRPLTATGSRAPGSESMPVGNEYSKQPKPYIGALPHGHQEDLPEKKIFPPLKMDQSTGRPILPRRQIIVGGRSAASNGSFVAFFHFTLDRVKFEAFTRSTAEMLGGTWTRPRHVSAKYVAERLMGRTRAGWSVLERAQPPSDRFSYTKPVEDGPKPDPSGMVCPLGAHVRKMNPRFDGPPSDHMIVRRSLMTEDKSALLFVCYQSDLAMGIEKLATWANSTLHPEENTTADPIISRGSQNGDLGATILIPKPRTTNSEKPTYPVRVQNDWAYATSGFYGFVPSKATLHRLISPRTSPGGQRAHGVGELLQPTKVSDSFRT